MTVGRSVALAIAAASFSASAPAGAQTRRLVQGVVLDGSNQPVPMVAVLVGGVGSVFTDDSGRFRLTIPHGDPVTLDLRRVGFMPSRFGLRAGGDTSLSVLLLALSQALPAFNVVTRNVRPPALVGFEERMKERRRGSGGGVFITADDIAKTNPSRVSQALESVPSLVVQRVGNGERYSIFGRTPTGAACAATVFLDGIRLGSDSRATVDRRGRSTGDRDIGAPIDEYVTPLDLAGIEVYQRALVAPAQFQPLHEKEQNCAIVVLWTKHG